MGGGGGQGVRVERGKNRECKESEERGGKVLEIRKGENDKDIEI